MKDLSTGKTYLTKRTKQIAGPVFARAGYNIEHLHGERKIMRASAKTLTDEEADCLLVYLKAVLELRAKRLHLP
jgi:hypothetical protein